MASLIIVAILIMIAMLLSSGLTAWVIWKFNGNEISFLPDADVKEGKGSIINSPAREARLLDKIFRDEMEGKYNADI